MKKIIAILAFLSFCIPAICASKHIKNEQQCKAADNIIGTYFIEYGGQRSRVKVFREGSTYSCRVLWLEKDRDKNGNKILDLKNPDKALRRVPADSILIFWDLKYDTAKKKWVDGNIYDPTHGFMANCDAEFVDDGSVLQIFGNVFGIGKSVYWKYLFK